MALTPRKTPAKSLDPNVRISDETRTIIERKTGIEYIYSKDLPKDLDLSSTDIKDVSALGGVKILNLSYCTKITDVSMLGNVEVLILAYCTSITDVSMLGNVLTLSLRGCSSITDVSMLGNVRMLALHGCPNIKDFSAVPQANRCRY